MGKRYRRFINGEWVEYEVIPRRRSKPRSSVPKPKTPPEPLPSPDEIQDATAEIREGWTEKTHRERAGMKRKKWKPPVVSLDDVPAEVRDALEEAVDDSQ